MTSVALANLDFEMELAGGAGYRTPGSLLDKSRQWSHVLRLLPQARSAQCLDPEVLDGSAPFAKSGSAVDSLVAWGVTPRLLRLAQTLAIPQDFPSLPSVRLANDKRTSHMLERQLGIALPFSRLVADPNELRDAVAKCPYDWVLKHPFGFSARERALGKRGQLSDSSFGWAARRLGQGWSLLFEPWVECSQNFSLHFEIAPCQTHVLGHCQLLTDAGGVYRGNRVHPRPPDPDALSAGLAVCDQLAAAGYWGPVGIDGLRGVLGGQAVFRPLVEINARCSFGRLTLALTDWVPAGWSYLWWFPSRKDSWRIPPSLPPLPEPPHEPVPGVYGLPLVADPRGCTGTAVLIAPTARDLAKLEESLGIPDWQDQESSNAGLPASDRKNLE